VPAILLSGAGSPNIGPLACTAPTTGASTFYIDSGSANLDMWRCSGTNAWRLLLDSNGTGTGGLTLPEGAALPGVVSNDVLWADSTQHGLMKNDNNSGAKRVPGVTGSVAVNDCPKFADTFGNIVSSGAPCAVAAPTTTTYSIQAGGCASGTAAPTGFYGVSGVTYSCVAGQGAAAAIVSNSGTAEFRFGQYLSPTWTGTVSVKILVIWPNHNASTISFHWYSACIKTGDIDFDTPAVWNDNGTVSFTSSAGALLQTTGPASVSTTGCTAGDYLSIRGIRTDVVGGTGLSVNSAMIVISHN